MPKPLTVDALIDRLVDQLTSEIEAQAVTRAREAVTEAFNGGAPPRARRVSAGQRLAGRYMGALKGFKGREREQVRALRAAKGVEAALDLMSKLAARAN